MATSEGDLTVARATLRLNELLIKNAITKTDDPAIDEMPVIPLDTKGPDDPNAAKSIDDLIAEAEKNRPDVAQDEIAMQKAEQNLKSIKSELLAHLECLWRLCRSGHRRAEESELQSWARNNALRISPRAFGDMFAEHVQLLLAGISVRNESVRSTCATASPRPISFVPCWSTGRTRSPLRSRRRPSASTCATRSSRCSRRRPRGRRAEGARPGAAYLRHHPAGTETRRQVQLRYAGRAARPGALPNPLLWPHKRRLKKPKWISTAPPG